MFSTIANVILVASGPLVLWGIKYFGQKITNLLADYVQSKTQNESLVNIVKRTDEAAMRIVKSVYMTYVDAIKKNSGALTDEEKAHAKNLAIDKLKSYLGSAGLEELANIFGYTQEQRDKYLGDQIEASVYDVKHGKLSGIGNGSINLGWI